MAETFELQSEALGAIFESLQQRIQGHIGKQTVLIALLAAQETGEEASVGMHCCGGALEDYIAVLESAVARLKARLPATPDPELPEGFIRWNGGSHGPDSLGRPIRIILRDGDDWVAYSGSEGLNWSHYTQDHGSGRDIIGYKILGEGES